MTEKLRYAAIALGFCGCLLHLYTTLFKASGPPSLSLLGFFLWSSSPYAVAAVFLMLRFNPAALGVAAGALLGDLLMHYWVFIAPAHSTAALGLLVMPLWNLMILSPIGGLVVWGIDRFVRLRGTSP